MSETAHSAPLTSRSSSRSWVAYRASNRAAAGIRHRAQGSMIARARTALPTHPSAHHTHTHTHSTHSHAHAHNTPATHGPTHADMSICSGVRPSPGELGKGKGGGLRRGVHASPSTAVRPAIAEAVLKETHLLLPPADARLLLPPSAPEEVLALRVWAPCARRNRGGIQARH